MLKNKYQRFTFMAVFYTVGSLLVHKLLHWAEPITYKDVIQWTIAGILFSAIMSAIFKHGTPPAKENNQNKEQ